MSDLSFAPRKGATKAKRPKPKPAELTKRTPHKAVSVRRIADYLGVDIRVIHGYVRRGSLRAFYPPGKKTRHVYADEAAALVRASKVKRGDIGEAAVRKGQLLSWNKGDGRREVGLIKSAKPKGLVEVVTTHSSMLSLCERLEERIRKRHVVVEDPKGVVTLAVRYLEYTEPEHPAIDQLRQALECWDGKGGKP